MVIKKDQHILRKDPGYRAIEERLGDYFEVEKNLTADEIKAQSARCLSCGTPFCHGYACPLANVIPETNELVREGRWEEALAILTSTHQFPEFTARICPALCEGSCVLGINDQPVTIRQIEKMIIEKGFAMGWVKPRLPQKRHAETVAVIGSGPAGLAAADHLNQKGYRVAVFEKELSPGGLLLYGIPNFKLDKKVVKRRIKLMKEEGIIFECGVTVGLDISYNYLKKRFSALIMTGGTQQPRDIDIPGRNLSGIFYATEYLRDQNKVISGELLDSDQKISATAKNVVVIGGGDTGSDCMGTALRQGARQVYQVEIMPRLPEGRAQSNPWPLWPRIDRISSSHQEGGVRRWSVRPLRFEGDDSGIVKRLHCIEVEWVFRDGQHTPVDKPGTDFSIEANLVLLAMGFLGPGPDPLADALALQRDSRGNIFVDSNHMTSKAGIFSAGDMARGQSLVVQAMADGKAAADHVDLFISSNRNA